MTVELVTSPELDDVDTEPRYLQWTPVIAGAFGATALSLILVTFAATIGLGVSSTAPTWRDASVALWLLSGLYLILQAVFWIWRIHRRPHSTTDCCRRTRRSGEP
jgi:hypothetical protein